MGLEGLCEELEPFIFLPTLFRQRKRNICLLSDEQRQSPLYILRTFD